MEDLYLNFTILITRLNKLVQKIKAYEMSKYNLQPIHVSCGYYLIRNPQGLTAKELCEYTLEDKAAISRALKTMQERGFVEYVPHGRNERVQLTNEGKNLANSIRERIDLAVKAGSANFKDEERKFFYNSLLEISNNLIDYYQSIIKSEE